MDIRAILGIVAIAVALVLGALAFGAGDAARSRFLSLPRGKAGGLRVLLGALVAYVAGAQFFLASGYSLPALQPLGAGIVLYPLIALALGSLLALFVERRAGIVFSLISVLLIAVVTLDPTYP